MALLSTLLTVIGILAGMAAFLWFSATIEMRQLGPVDLADNTAELARLGLD